MPEITDYIALKRRVIEMQEELVFWAIANAGGNKTQAAKNIKMDRRQLQRICERHDAAQPQGLR
jgi:transcriptional regulator with GAF, ATPase, and Fis domain